MCCEVAICWSIPWHGETWFADLCKLRRQIAENPSGVQLRPPILQKYGFGPHHHPYISEMAFSHRFQKVYTYPPPKGRKFGALDQKFIKPRKSAKTHSVGTQRMSPRDISFLHGRVQDIICAPEGAIYCFYTGGCCTSFAHSRVLYIVCTQEGYTLFVHVRVPYMVCSREGATHCCIYWSVLYCLYIG